MSTENVPTKPLTIQEAEARMNLLPPFSPGGLDAAVVFFNTLGQASRALQESRVPKKE